MVSACRAEYSRRFLPVFARAGPGGDAGIADGLLQVFGFAGDDFARAGGD
jgi:hypothetical protein